MFLSKWIGVAALLGATVLSGVAQANPALLFDLKDGRVLEQRDAFKRWHPASLTKLMTAYVAFRAVQNGELRLDSPIKVTKNAAKQPPSKMGYPAGSVMNLDNAFKMMLVKSSNDIAMAIGENVGGTEQAFVDRMNAEAQRLGMNDTHYVNPNGLHADDQYTTARDQALLVTAIKRDFPQYANYFAIEGLVAGKKTLNNFNLLVGRYKGVDGMKTGFVCPSGFNMIGSATRDGRTLVAIALGETTALGRADAVAALLDKGFAATPAAGPNLASLPVPADHAAPPTNMREVACPAPKKKVAKKGKGAKETKDAKVAKDTAAEPSENAEAAGPSRWREPLDHAPTYVQVGLGNASGPVPAGWLNAGGDDIADVPIPGWRPDMPDPTLTAMGDEQGDAAQKQRPN